MVWRYSRKHLQISPKSDTLIFLSKMVLMTFLVFGRKLVLNMTFNLSETYFSEKFPIGEYLTSKLSKKCPNWGFGHFLDFASLVFVDFAHNDSWTWCLVVFLQFTGPDNVFLFLITRFSEDTLALYANLVDKIINIPTGTRIFWNLERTNKRTNQDKSAMHYCYSFVHQCDNLVLEINVFS